MPGTQNALAELAYLRRSCDFLLSDLRSVEKELEHTHELTEAQAAVLDAETFLAGSDIRSALEKAAASAESWLTRVKYLQNL